MEYFRSGLKSVLGAPQQGEQPSGAETVERLVDRVFSSTLLEDRRDACRALKSLSRKYRVEVGAHGMTAFCHVLQTDYADCEIVGYALEALCNITSDEIFEEEEWPDTPYKPVSNVGAQFTEIFIKQPDNVSHVLTFLEEYDFRVRWPAVKLLKCLLANKPKEVQEIVLVSPMGVSKLMDLLSDGREVVRNDALLLLRALTKGNANIQKIVAFENAFDRLFDVISEEGYADGDIIVEDCLLLMLNLLKNNVSNQNFFKEGSYIQRLTPMFNIPANDEQDIGWSQQKIANIHAVLQVIRTLVSPANPSQATVSCQRALRTAGIVESLSSILMAGGVPVDVLTETITTVAEAIRGNLSNQEYFATVLAPSNPPREAIYVLLMSMVNERQPFLLRCSVLYCFQCFLFKNEIGQSKLIQTLLPSSSEVASVSAGQLLCGGLFSNDTLSHWFSAVALSHALIENPAAKESMLRVLLTPVSGHTPLSLLHHVTLILQQSGKVQSKIGFLILLATWLSHCPPAIRHFLSIDTSISYLTTQAGASEHDDNEELVQGLCAFLMGLCLHFNDDSVPSFSKENLRQLIIKRVGLEVFLDKLSQVSRHEMYSRAAKHPNIRVTSPNDLLLDYEFCKLFKVLEGLVMKAVTANSNEITNGGIPENIDQYKSLIREQDKKITELSRHYESLYQQSIQQAEKISALSDENCILKAQLNTNTAVSQQENNISANLHLLQEKDGLIAKLEEEIRTLKLCPVSENKALSPAESQAVDSQIIYLKSQVQALQQTEKELNDLRKDQEDLLELVADQEKEIELLKNKLKEYEENTLIIKENLLKEIKGEESKISDYQQKDFNEGVYQQKEFEQREMEQKEYQQTNYQRDFQQEEFQNSDFCQKGYQPKEFHHTEYLQNEHQSKDFHQNEYRPKEYQQQEVDLVKESDEQVFTSVSLHASSQNSNPESKSASPSTASPSPANLVSESQIKSEPVSVNSQNIPQPLTATIPQIVGLPSQSQPTASPSCTLPSEPKLSVADSVSVTPVNVTQSSVFSSQATSTFTSQSVHPFQPSSIESSTSPSHQTLYNHQPQLLRDSRTPSPHPAIKYFQPAPYSLQTEFKQTPQPTPPFPPSSVPYSNQQTILQPQLVSNPVSLPQSGASTSLPFYSFQQVPEPYLLPSVFPGQNVAEPNHVFQPSQHPVGSNFPSSAPLQANASPFKTAAYPQPNLNLNPELVSQPQPISLFSSQPPASSDLFQFKNGPSF